MASKLVNVVKAFTLTIKREGQVVVERFEAGIQRLEQDAADHWYTKAHSADMPKGVKQTDAEAEAEAKAAQEKADAEELAKMEAEEKAAEEAKEKADAEAAAKASNNAKK